MKIGSYYEGVELFRKEKIVFGHLLAPHRVLSTCRLNGGAREDIEYVFNHQSCEPRSHIGTDFCEVALKEPERYQRRIASKAGLPFEKCVSLGTAANMNNTAVAVEQFGQLTVVAATTAGVGTNGGRAGDRASYYQSEEGSVIIGKPAPKAGTINTMLFVSEEMSNGALVAAATLMAEAKASVLQELMAPSRYSSGIATGTGTDQIAIASRLGTRIRHTDANKHAKLGELIGLSVRKSLQDALNLQSGMTPDSRRSVTAQLQRFGESPERFIENVKSLLDKGAAALFDANFLSANHDPLTVASVQALAHMWDQFSWGVLPKGCMQEVMTAQAALVCSAVAGREVGRDRFHVMIGDLPMALTDESLVSLARRSIAEGYRMKWSGRFED